MATLHVRNVPDELYELLRRQAEANGRSIGAEAIQLLHERLEAPRPRPSLLRGRRSAGTFSRFSGEARDLVVEAQVEARTLRHGFIGTEHLLLALLRPDAPVADALAGLGVTAERARAEVERCVGQGEAPPLERIPFTPRGKKALERASREAEALGDGVVFPEHIGLALLALGEGVAFEVLRALQPDVAAIRRRLTALRADARARPLVEEPPFRVVDLEGDAADWEDALNDATQDGYRVVAIVDDRAVLERLP